jgi:hypothetical protein
VDNNENLKKLFGCRDKILAHQERLTNDLKDEFKFWPSLGSMEEINGWAENFCTLSVSLLSNITLLPPSFSARIAALNVVAKVLDKNFETGCKDHENFYKRLA